MKTLYVQIVLTFLGAILISLIITFLISGRIHMYQVGDRLETRMEEVGKDIIQLYKGTPEMDETLYFDSMSSVSFDLLLMKEQSDTPVYGKNLDQWGLQDDELQKVLAGGVYRGHDLPPRKVVGLPFQKGEESYALFLRPNFKFFFQDFEKLMLILFSTILVIGSVIFLISTRWIISPIKEMTQSTKELARGNFNVFIKNKRKDELGNLTNSFNQMTRGLGELDEMRHQFVTNVSHEIQTPLTSIQGFAKALKDGVVKDASQQKEYLSIIEQESKRLSVLSQNLLKLARLDTDQDPIQPVPYQLDEQLRRVITFLEPQWTAKENDIQLDVKPLKIEGDKDQLEQVWINLLTNAIRYNPVGGIIKVTAKASFDHVEIAISDHGEGIAEEEQHRIFDRFYKVDPSRSKQNNGNGLGLSIAQKITQLHGGKIEVESDVGVGTTFYVTLPLKAHY